MTENMLKIKLQGDTWQLNKFKNLLKTFLSISDIPANNASNLIATASVAICSTMSHPSDGEILFSLEISNSEIKASVNQETTDIYIVLNYNKTQVSE